MKPQIFISYKSEEYHYADKVRFMLEQNGISCWMAPESIPGGASYATEIPRAIRECKGFVLILTDKSQNSQWVPRELDRAINAGKVIFPFVPERVKLNDDITFYLTNVQMYPAYEDWDREIGRLISDVSDVVGVKPVIQPGPPVEEPAPKPEKKPKKQKTPKPVKKQPDDPQKPKKRGKIVLFSVLAGIVVLAGVIGLISFITYQSNSVMILNQRYDKNDRELVLSDVSLSEQDIKAIAEFKELGILKLSHCELGTTDLSPLSHKSLYRLQLSGCDLTADSFRTIDLSEMKLTDLDLSDNPQFKALDVLADCKELTVLKVSGDGLTTLKPLSGMTKLRTLIACNNALNTLEGVETCIYLEKVNVSNNQLTSLEGLNNATLLTKVWFSDNHISDVSPLKNAYAAVKTLGAGGNQLTDLSEVAQMTALTHLDLSHNRLTDIGLLSALKNLSALDVSFNALTKADADSLSGTLIYLDLSFNQIREINGGFQINSYAQGYLNLEGNALHTVPIRENKAYRLLNVADNPLDSVSALSGMESAKVLIVGYTADFDAEAIYPKVVDALYLIDCPLDKQVGISEVFGNRVHYLSLEEFREKRDECQPNVSAALKENQKELKGTY